MPNTKWSTWRKRWLSTNCCRLPMPQTTIRFDRSWWKASMKTSWSSSSSLRLFVTSCACSSWSCYSFDSAIGQTKPIEAKSAVRRTKTTFELENSSRKRCERDHCSSTKSDDCRKKTSIEYPRRCCCSTVKLLCRAENRSAKALKRKSNVNDDHRRRDDFRSSPSSSLHRNRCRRRDNCRTETNSIDGGDRLDNGRSPSLDRRRKRWRKSSTHRCRSFRWRSNRKSLTSNSKENFWTLDRDRIESLLDDKSKGEFRRRANSSDSLGTAYRPRAATARPMSRVEGRTSRSSSANRNRVDENRDPPLNFANDRPCRDDDRAGRTYRHCNSILWFGRDKDWTQREFRWPDCWSTRRWTWRREKRQEWRRTVSSVDSSSGVVTTRVTLSTVIFSSVSFSHSLSELWCYHVSHLSFLRVSFAPIRKVLFMFELFELKSTRRHDVANDRRRTGVLKKQWRTGSSLSVTRRCAAVKMAERTATKTLDILFVFLVQHKWVDPIPVVVHLRIRIPPKRNIWNPPSVRRVFSFFLHFSFGRFFRTGARSRPRGDRRTSAERSDRIFGDVSLQTSGKQTRRTTGKKSNFVESRRRISIE